MKKQIGILVFSLVVLLPCAVVAQTASSSDWKALDEALGIAISGLLGIVIRFR